MIQKEGLKNSSTVELVKEWIGLSRLTLPLNEEDLGSARQLVHSLYEARNWPKIDDSRVVLSPSPLATILAAGVAALAWGNKKHCQPLEKRRSDDQVKNDLIRCSRTKSFLNAGQVYDQVRICMSWSKLLVAVPVVIAADVFGYLFKSEHSVCETVSNLLTESVAVPTVELFEACSGGDMTSRPVRSMCEEVGSGLSLDLLDNMLESVQLGNLSPALPAFVDYLARHESHLPANILLESELARFTGPWVMHPKFCVLTARPSELHLNREGLLHSERGPACRWRDGTRIYALKNVQTKSSFVDRPDDETADSLKRLPTSQRRVCIPRLPKAEQVVLATLVGEDD